MKKNVVPGWFNRESALLPTVVRSGDLPRAQALFDQLVADKSPEMQKAWRTLDSRVDKTEIDDFPKWFFWHLYNHGVIGPNEFRLMTQSEILQLVDRIDAAVKEIEILVNKTKTNFPLTIEGRSKESDFLAAVKSWRLSAHLEIGADRVILDRPQKGNAKKRYFCIRIYEFFEAAFGRRLESTIAAFASVIFDELTDREYVKDVLNQFSKSNRPVKPQKEKTVGKVKKT